jgi:hypothetical protein
MSATGGDESAAHRCRPHYNLGFVPAAPFFVDLQTALPALRLPFSTSPADLKEAVSRLAGSLMPTVVDIAH